jgi:ribonuclease P protein component
LSGAAHDGDAARARTGADRQGLPRDALLRRRRDFLRVLAAGRRQQGAFMNMCAYIPECARGETGQHLAVVARKKEFTRAVDRNRVKRRLREVARLQRPQLRPDLWLVLQARTGALRAPWPALQHEFLTLCQSAALLREPAGV